MNTHFPSIRPEDEIDPFAPKMLPGELIFYDKTKENWGFFSGRSPLRIALTTQAVIYESSKKKLRIPIEEVYYSSGSKNSPAHVSWSEWSFKIPGDFRPFESLLVRVLRVRDEGIQSLESLHEALQYETDKRTEENILTTGIARNPGPELLCCGVWVVILSYISGGHYENPVVLVLGALLVCYFLFFGIRTYYILRESAIVEHYFFLGNIKNTFLLKDIASISREASSVTISFTSGTKKEIFNMRNAEIFVQSVQDQLHFSDTKHTLWKSSPKRLHSESAKPYVMQR